MKATPLSPLGFCLITWTFNISFLVLYKKWSDNRNNSRLLAILLAWGGTQPKRGEHCEKDDILHAVAVHQRESMRQHWIITKVAVPGFGVTAALAFEALPPNTTLTSCMLVLNRCFHGIILAYRKLSQTTHRLDVNEYHQPSNRRIPARCAACRFHQNTS